jgi:hypothetical protein
VLLAAAERVKAKQAIPLLDEGDDLGQTLFGDADEENWIKDDLDENDEPQQPPMETKAQAKLRKVLENRNQMNCSSCSSI